ncbi:MAG: DUF4199 domain-containing protein [Bacteroidetes bacterium]|nr:DUF4199 domain-containing protein [Bacteroidota bacterium]
MNYNKYLPSIITGFGAAVLSTIPGIKNLNCCLIIPAAAFLSLYLYNKSTGNDSPIKLNKALSYGLITGLIAALFSSLFDILITFITHSNDLVVGLEQTEEMMQELNLGALMDASMEIMRTMVKEIEATGFSALYTVMITISNFFIFSIFGMLGGLLGMAVLNKRNRPQV